MIRQTYGKAIPGTVPASRADKRAEKQADKRDKTTRQGRQNAAKPYRQAKATRQDHKAQGDNTRDKKTIQDKTR